WARRCHLNPHHRSVNTVISFSQGVDSPMKMTTIGILLFTFFALQNIDPGPEMSDEELDQIPEWLNSSLSPVEEAPAE
ncbi:MAG: hypothetical protein ACRDG9_02385, partial [Actinomycetota bacterium]